MWQLGARQRLQHTYLRDHNENPMHLKPRLLALVMAGGAAAFNFRTPRPLTFSNLSQLQQHQRQYWPVTLQRAGHGRKCRTITSSNAHDVPEELRQANQKAHEEVWASRRGMARATLSAARAFRTARTTVAGKRQQVAEGDDAKLAQDGKEALVVSAVGLAVAAATVRVGGRAALVSVRDF